MAGNIRVTRPEAAATLDPLHHLVQRRRRIGNRLRRWLSDALARPLRYLRRMLDVRLGAQLRVHRLDETPRFFICDVVKNLPLIRIQRGCCEDRRGDGEAVRRKIFEQSDRQGQGRDRSCRGGPQRFIDSMRFVPDCPERLGNRRATAVRARARDEIHQLTPAYRRIVPILGGLVQDGLQTIVKAHWLFVSLERTLLLLYARVYNALSTQNLTAP